MWPLGCSSTESPQGTLNAGQHFDSRNMNLNYFITKVIICRVMRIDRFDDINSGIVYFGIHRGVGLMRRFSLVRT